MSALITVAPREPRSLTVARPMPEEPPVVVGEFCDWVGRDGAGKYL